MGEWTPLVVGFGYIIIVILSMLVFPRSWWTKELTLARGIRPSGLDGGLTRLDHFRAAGLSFLISLLLLIGAFLVLTLADRYPNLSMANHIAEAYGFMCFLLAALAALVGLIATWNGIFRRGTNRTPPQDGNAPAI